MKAKKKITADEINVPKYAHDVPGGYPVHVFDQVPWAMIVHVYGPIMASPRPRVTSRGTFMPHDYRKHCDKLGASLAYARGLYENGNGTGVLPDPWPASAPLMLDIAFWAVRQPGDLDNLAKTVMDAGQLHRGEPSGAELWTNDRQIRNLSVAWVDCEDPEWTQTVIRIRHLEAVRGR